MRFAGRRRDDSIGHPVHDAAPQIADYTLLERIGAGSYGEVWRARSVTGAERALKVVHRRSFQHDRPYRREFEGIQKFESLARGHPHLVTVFHVGRLEADEAFYYVMELADAVPGTATDRYAPRTLRSDLDAGAPLTATALVQLGVALTEALGHLHRHGLIHRDVKPSNIIFVGGLPKLADIGLVAEAGENRSFVGTEGFVPPEGPGTPQGDLFSVGKVLYEAMTGRDRTEFPELPANFGARPDHGALLELNEIILRACERDPARRHATAEDLLGELRLLQGGLSLRRLRQTERRLRFFRRVGIGAAVLALFAFVAVGLARREAARQRANFNAAETLRLRAEAAERSAREQLHETSVALSRASRLSLSAGRRERALAAIRAGSAVRSSQELADELIGVLASDDVRPAGVLTHLPSRPGLAFNSRLTEMALPWDGTVSVRSVPESQERLRLECPEPGAPVLLWSADDRWLLARHGSGRVRIWAADTGDTVLDTQSVGPFPTIARGRVLLPFPHERRVELRDLPAGRKVADLKFDFDFDATALSPDGESIAVNPLGIPFFRILAANDGRKTHEFALDSSTVGLAWSADSRWIAVGSDDNAVYLWSLASGGPQLRLIGHQNLVHDVAFIAGGRLLMSSAWDGTTRFWEVPTGREVLRLGDSGHVGYGETAGRLAVHSYRADEIKLYDFVQPSVVRTLSLPATNRLISPFGAAFSPDGQHLAVGAWDGAHVFNLSTGNRVVTVPEPFARSVSFLDQGHTLLVSGQHSCRRWPLKPGASGLELAGPAATIAGGHRWNLASADPNQAVALAREDEVRLVAPGQPTRSFRRPQQQFQRVALSPNGRWLAAGGGLLPGFAVWDRESGEIAPWSPPPSNLGCEVVFSPDSRWLLVSDEGRFTAHSTADGRAGWTIPRQDTSNLFGLAAFTADGRFLACAVSRTLVSLHSAATGEVLARLEHPDPQQVLALAFSDDASQLAVVGPVHQVRVWNLRLLGREVAAAGLPWPLPYP